MSPLLRMIVHHRIMGTNRHVALQLLGGAWVCVLSWCMHCGSVDVASFVAVVCRTLHVWECAVRMVGIVQAIRIVVFVGI